MLPPFRSPSIAVALLVVTVTPRLEAQQSNPSEGCRQAVYARFSGADSSEVTVGQVSPSVVNWRTARGLSGVCVIERGRVVRVETKNLAQPVPPSVTGPLDRNTAALACKNEVSGRMPEVPDGQIRVEPGRTDRDGNLGVTWRTSRGAAGTCLVDAQGHVVDFRTTTAGPNQPKAAGGISRLTCESRENRRNECPLPEQVDVRLVRVISTSPCLEGRSWGWDDRKIWVTGGCRAEFELKSKRRPGYDLNRPDAAADLQALRACREEVLRRFPGTPNAQVTTSVASREGEGLIRVNWSMRRGGRGECRINRIGKVVQFRTAPGSPAGGRREDVTPGQGPGQVRQVTCESQGGDRRECAIPSGGRVRLVKVLSDAPCTEGQSWGYDSERIWVSSGCRADFEVEGPSR
jgi:hypothetical protein